MRIMLAGLLATGAAVLGACATTPRPAMSAEQCAVADWKAVGYQDGANGRAPERFASLQQACIAAGYGVDQDLYFAGRQDGLYTYCQPDRGFRMGVNGASYNGACPPELDGVFRDAHDSGLRAHRALSAVRGAESDLSSLRSRLNEIERKIAANESGLIASQTDAERERHRSELIRLRDERSRMNADLRETETELRFHSRDLTRLRNEIGFHFGDW